MSMQLNVTVDCMCVASGHICCQNVTPDPHTSCGPYRPVPARHFQPSTAGNSEEMRLTRHSTDDSHDTVGIVALDIHGNVAGGTTTNGATFKIPGFVTAASSCR